MPRPAPCWTGLKHGADRLKAETSTLPLTAPFPSSETHSESESGSSVPSYKALLSALWRDRRIDTLAMIAAVTAVPISIAVSETLLSISFALSLVRLVRDRDARRLPRIFWFWLAWAALELVSWGISPEPRAGRNEISHLLLIAALFVSMTALERADWRVLAWRGLLTAASLGSFFVVGDVVWRLIYYRRELAADSDPSLYLRTGGLLNNWMVFGTVEVVVFAGLLAFCGAYPEQKRFWVPVLILNSLAVVISLTRMVWVCCFVLLEADLFWRRSRWRWACTFLPLLFFAAGPGFLRARVRVSLQPGYYANAERIQMLRVGWKMLKEHPFTGVGPGRVQELYRSFLVPTDPVPAYYGHLHNNPVQIAAQFGVPVAVAALLVLAILFLDIRRSWNTARMNQDRKRLFLCRAGILALAGFALAGMFEYTYGHSLGLIAVCFASLAPLTSSQVINPKPSDRTS